MIRARHPHVADDIVVAFNRNHPAFHLQGANGCRSHLVEFRFDAHDWRDAARQLDPPLFEFEKTGPWCSWLAHAAAKKLEEAFHRGGVWPAPHQHREGTREISRWANGSSFPSFVCPRLHCPVPTPRCFVSFLSLAVSGSLSPSLRATACVAVHLTLVATTAQLVQGLGG